MRVQALRVVLSCVTARRNSISLGQRQNLQSLLINNSYPPFIAADSLILAALIADNYLVCAIMSPPDEMKPTQRNSGKPSAPWITAGFSHCVENHQLHESIRSSPAFFLLLIIAIESMPVSDVFPRSQSEDLCVETT